MRKLPPVLLALALATQPAAALSLAGTRRLRNVQTAIGSVQLLPELRNGPSARETVQTARNLLRDLDSALARGQGELGRMTVRDRADPAAQDAARKLEEFPAFRADLHKAQDGATTASAASDAQFRALREQTRPFATVVSAFRKGPHGTLDQVRAGMAELGGCRA